MPVWPGRDGGVASSAVIADADDHLAAADLGEDREMSDPRVHRRVGQCLGGHADYGAAALVQLLCVVVLWTVWSDRHDRTTVILG